jgi:PAS domain S-box-containing protein
MKQNKLTRDELVKKLEEAEKLITELRQAPAPAGDGALMDSQETQEAYIESEQNFRNALDACPLGVRIITKNGDLLYANQTIMTTFQCHSYEDLTKIARQQIYTPESYAEHQERKRKRKLGEYIPPEYQISIRRPDGEIRNLWVFRKEIMWDGEVQYMSVYEDITEKNQAEQKLSDEATRRRILIEQSRDGIVIMDQNGSVYDANLRFADMLGYTLEEVRKLSIWDWEFQYPREQVVEMIRTIDEAGDHFESRHRRKDGSFFDVEISSNGAIFAGQKLIFCVCRDITEQKRAQAALKESEEKYHSLVENSNDGILIIRDNRVIYFNPNMVEIGGYLPEDVMGKPFLDFIAPEQQAAIAQIYLDLLSGKKERKRVEVIILAKDGRQIYTETSASIFEYDGKPALIAIIRDISERKKAEEALKASERFLDSVIENTPNPIWVSDENGTVIRMNQSLRDLLDVTDAEIIGKYNVMQDTQVNAQGFLPLVKSVFEQGKTVSFTLLYNTASETELKLEHSKTLVLEITISAIRDGNGKVIHAICQQKDITQRTRTEAALRESEEKFRSLFETMEQGVIYQDAEAMVTAANPAARRILGLTHDELVGKASILNRQRKRLREDGSLMPIDEHPAMVAFNTGKRVTDFVMGAYNAESHVLRWISISAVPEFRPGENVPYRVYTTFTDVTERRKMEEALRYHAKLVENISDAVVSSDNKLKILSWNKGAEDMYGWKAEEAIGRLLPEAIVKISSSDSDAYIKEQLDKNAQWTGEAVHRRKDGRTFNVLFSASQMRDAQGNDQGAVNVFKDITERKKAEDIVRYHAKLVENISDAVVSSDQNYKIISWNKGAEDMYGWKAEDVIGKTLSEAIAVDSSSASEAFIKEQLDKNAHWTGEAVHRHKDGRKINILISASQMKDAAGNDQGAVSVFKDITERRKAEEAIHRSEERFRRIFQTGPLGIVMTDLNDNFTMANDRYCQMVGFTEEELKKRHWQDFTLPEETSTGRQNVEKLQKGEIDIFHTEKREIRKDKTVFWASLTVTLLRDNDGKPQGILSMLEDITDRKKAEESTIYHARLLENVSDAIISSDDKYNILSWNHAAERIYGWSAAEVIGKDMNKLIKPVHQEGTTFKGNDEALRLELIKATHWEGEVIHHRKDGTEFWVMASISILRDEKGKDRGAVASYKDITERKRLEESIRYHAGLLENVSDAIFSSNKEHNLLSWNKAAERIFGWKEEEVLGKKAKEFIAPVFVDSNEAEIQEIVDRTGSWQGETIEHLRDGTQINMLASISTRKDSQGQIIGSVTLLKDITERKQAEERIRYQASLLENVTDAIISSDVNDRLVSWNKAAEHIFGWKEEEVLGKTNADVTKPVFLDFDGESLKTTALKTGEWHGESIEHRKDGTPVNMLLSVRVIKDSRDNPIGTVVVFKDITERKQAEELIRESEERFSKAFHASPNLMAVISISDRRILDVNEIFSVLTGYQREELIGKNVFDLNLWVESGRQDEFARIMAETGKIKDVEVSLRTKTGDLRTLLFSGEKVMLGGIPCLIVAAIDITERKQFEERLNHLNLTLRSIRNVNQLITREKDRDKLIQGVCNSLVESHSFNSAWIILFNETQKPLTWAESKAGEAFNTLVELFQQGKLPRCVKKALKQKGTVLTENPLLSCQDCPMPKSDETGTMTIRLEIEGKTYGILGASMPKSLLAGADEESLFSEVAMDISFALRDIELGASHQLLEQERLRTAKLESIGTLAGGIAHDFNNFLTGIMGNIGLAKTMVQPTEELFEMLDEAEQASMRARDLTRQLLTFSRGGQPVKKLVDVTDLIQESASFSLRGSNAKLSLSLPGNLWAVEADEGQISQVINNLVINADEAMPTGGILSIKAENVVLKGNVGLSLPNGNYLHISVKDTGIGMSQENLQRIFEPYFTTKQRGSGLGLTSTYSIIKNHGGQIFAESIINQGSTFHIYLPASKKTLKGRQNLATDMPVQAGGKVLIMDDEDIIRKMLKNMLTLAGYQVEVSSDGREALVKYVDAKKAGDGFDAVIMDLTIPGGMGGQEAVKKLLEIDPGATVIVSSGYATDPIMSEFKKYGFKAVIAKPYSVKQLQDTLSEVTRKKKR